ncbi:hypothetical protein THS5294_01552 [Thalassobacter stenotrophicus]|uniref:Uncharacterized protein n=2 Tax=Thalassobacter stenotrophicus TaxID=266809 RepID=A0A0P1FM49_9RHOB|nr:hypothetical protein THS5294_01552 [Thalassobacter stenotrophicus]SHI71454.1 hypothetical protein SAMN02744035_01343 [Thalassobacter stenotrophicus DSM 16310]
MTSFRHVIHARIDADMKLFYGNSAFRSHNFQCAIKGLALKFQTARYAKTKHLLQRAVALAAGRFFGFEAKPGGIIAMTSQCFVCGNPVAPFGFGWPGPRSQKPTDKCGYLRTCGEHRPAGEQRRLDAIAKAYGRPTPSKQETTPTNTKGINA